MQSLGVTFDHMGRERCRALRPSWALLTVLLAGGCAAPKPPTPQEQVAAWLSDSPRTIAVSVDPKLPQASLVSRDHHTGARVGYGVLGAAEGALVTIGGGCRVGGPLGCLAGAFLAPIGAVVGAVVRSGKVQSTEDSHPIGAAQGAAEMLAANRVIDLPAMLAAAVSERPVRPHTLHAVQYNIENKSLATAEGTLRLQVYGFDFLGAVGDDPEVALMLKVGAEMHTSTITAGWGGYTYEGSRRRVSAWLADDARRLREESNLAVRSLASDIRQDLNSPRSLKERSWYSMRDNSEQTITRATEWQRRIAAAKAREEFRPLGRIDKAGDALPSGALYVAIHTFRKLGQDDSGAWLVVNFDAPTQKGESSYVADTKAMCATGALSVNWWVTWSKENGQGNAIDSATPPRAGDR